MKRPELLGQEVQPNTCGLQAARNDELAFWQSRSTTVGGGVAPLPSLTDLPALAAFIRSTYPKGT